MRSGAHTQPDTGEGPTTAVRVCAGDGGNAVSGTARVSGGSMGVGVEATTPVYCPGNVDLAHVVPDGCNGTVNWAISADDVLTVTRPGGCSLTYRVIAVR